ncbi:hypothetical protein KX928_21100 [Roseobacter sp. YSTF-M11]|uniref:Uncharacterized protein n=2 Tax=Roseobacter insulae TaxID=2859783 RepID=A0A9X1K2J1_9RHOB|nr:hypothetical protein [Roseobacter insulae]
MSRRFLIACACLASPAWAASPIGEVVCSPSADMQTRMERQYGSEMQASGLRGREQVMEVWTDPQGDWTMVVRYASGTSCIVAMGEHWTEFDPDDPA